ncbi:MAG: hypothetical protein COS84_06565 [Armatimonadetes bacterium CG07_land_8_20_14_0_80_40_9]|nr:MAG: hypothetical protein COS84_06565 [Armatimonadetes bacterium CG07_land_8_20_14_0_80_40_9]
MEESRGSNYQLTYQLAQEELRKADLKEQCFKSGAVYEDSCITIKFLNQPYRIHLPEIEVSYEGKREEIPIKHKILILHYLDLAKGTALLGKWITFRDVPSGNFYYPTFLKIAINPYVQAFGRKIELLEKVALGFSAKRRDYGDLSMTISIFPYLPVTFVLWKGDEEFPPSGNILFDSTVADYLPTEDILIACESAVEEMIKVRS